MRVVFKIVSFLFIALLCFLNCLFYFITNISSLFLLAIVFILYKSSQAITVVAIRST